MVSTEWTYHKERSFASNYFIFLKILFQFKNLLNLIWCTNEPNAHIPTFCKRWSFISRWFFPVSTPNPILQKCHGMICEIIFYQTVSRLILIFCDLRFFKWFCCKEQFFQTVKSPKVKYLETYLFCKHFRTPCWRSYLHK